MYSSLSERFVIVYSLLYYDCHHQWQPSGFPPDIFRGIPLESSQSIYHCGRIESVSWCMVTFSDMCVIFSKPRHFKPVSTIFLFFHWMIALQKLWKCFLFYLKNSFRFWSVYIFVFFYLAFHFFQVQKDKWMWNNLCVMNWLEYIKRCKFLE